MTAPGEAHFVSHLILPAEMGRHISSTFYVEYSNTGNVAMPAPLLVLRARAVTARRSQPAAVDAQPGAGGLRLLDLGHSGGLLEHRRDPGDRHRSARAGSSRASRSPSRSTTPACSSPGPLGNVSSSSTSTLHPARHDRLDWSSLQASLQPPGISSTAWSAIFSGLTTQIGDTWGGYVTMLDDEASYLGQLGEDVTDVSELWAFAVVQADGLTPTPVLASVTDLDVAVPGDLSLDFTRIYQEPISSREALGPLGYGWTDDWQYSLSVASDGTVTVTMPSGEQRIFQPDSRGSDYFDQPGDYGILTEGTGGTFTLQETDGQIEAFNANGTLDYIQDTNGNRITAGYTGGQLTSLTDTSGAFADDRVQRGRTDRVGHQLRLAKLSTTPTTPAST